MLWARLDLHRPVAMMSVLQGAWVGSVYRTAQCSGQTRPGRGCPILLRVDDIR